MLEVFSKERTGDLRHWPLLPNVTLFDNDVGDPS